MTDENQTPPPEAPAASTPPLTAIDGSTADPAKYPTQFTPEGKKLFTASMEDFRVKVVQPAVGTLCVQVHDLAKREGVPSPAVAMALIISFAEQMAAQSLMEGGVVHYRKLARSAFNEAFEQAYNLEVIERQAAKNGPQDLGPRLEAVPDPAPSAPSPGPDGAA